MAKNINELREKRSKAIADMREFLERAEKEKRDMNAEEQEAYDKAFKEQERLGSEIKREEELRKLEREMAEETASGDRENRDSSKNGGEKQDKEKEIELRSAIFEKYVRYGREAPAYMNEEESRALQNTDYSQGGYLKPTEQFINQLIKAIDDMVFMRGIANVLPPVMGADTLGAPSLDNDPDDFDWTTELATGNEDSTMSFGKRELKPSPLAKRIKVSNTLLQRVSSGEALVRQRLGYKLGITQEKAYLTGNGASQPLGVFTASNDGIPTGRDVSTGNTTTSMTFDGLKECKYSLKGGYLRNSEWIFHRDGVKQISKLKDGEGKYLWQEGVTGDDPDRILGRPVNMSEYAPNTFTTGLYVGMLGDFSHYWIVDALTFQLQRLVELYAESNQVGFIGRYEGDGMPVLGEAFARVKLA